MNDSCDESVSLPTGVFKIPGEPAIIINGVPPLPSSDDNHAPCPVVNEVNVCKDTGFGEWLEGREVRKLFAGQYYSGKVTTFDKETGWYRVIYQDGDFEDLEWDELVEILQPLDITIPLKTLALKIIRKKEKSVQKSRKSRAKSRDFPDAGDKGTTSGTA